MNKLHKKRHLADTTDDAVGSTVNVLVLVEVVGERVVECQPAATGTSGDTHPSEAPHG